MMLHCGTHTHIGRKLPKFLPLQVYLFLLSRNYAKMMITKGGRRAPALKRERNGPLIPCQQVSLAWRFSWNFSFSLGTHSLLACPWDYVKVHISIDIYILVVSVCVCVQPARRRFYWWSWETERELDHQIHYLWLDHYRLVLDEMYSELLPINSVAL